jgi:hypothetical protein
MTSEKHLIEANDTGVFFISVENSKLLRIMCEQEFTHIHYDSQKLVLSKPMSFLYVYYIFR